MIGANTREPSLLMAELANKLYRDLQTGTAECRLSIKLDEHPVTRLARFGEARERLCMVATAKSIHTIKLNDDGSLQGKDL